MLLVSLLLSLFSASIIATVWIAQAFFGVELPDDDACEQPQDGI